MCIYIQLNVTMVFLTRRYENEKSLLKPAFHKIRWSAENFRCEAIIISELIWKREREKSRFLEVSTINWKVDKKATEREFTKPNWVQMCVYVRAYGKVYHRLKLQKNTFVVVVDLIIILTCDLPTITTRVLPSPPHNYCVRAFICLFIHSFVSFAIEDKSIIFISRSLFIQVVHSRAVESSNGSVFFYLQRYIWILMMHTAIKQ